MAVRMPRLCHVLHTLSMRTATRNGLSGVVAPIAGRVTIKARHEDPSAIGDVREGGHCNNAHQLRLQRVDSEANDEHVQQHVVQQRTHDLDDHESRGAHAS